MLASRATSKASHGAAVNSLALQTDPAYREAIIQYCDVIVPEGALKFDAKKRALLALCRSLKSKGVPLHGIGIQGHIDPNYTIDRPALETLVGRNPIKGHGDYGNRAGCD